MRGRAKHAFRIATLVLPSALAWWVAFAARHDRGAELARVVVRALGPLWVLLVVALLARVVAIVFGRARTHGAGDVAGEREDTLSTLARIDVLTASGSALAWLSAFAIMGAVWLGWASLAAVGILGTGLFHVVVLLAFVALRGGDPVRGATIARSFGRETFAEGDDVVEEIRVAGARVPIGFRMFVTGRVGRRWATSRHVVDAADAGAGAEIVLESEIGPAVRGDHEAEPLEIWLEDTFGLCRSARARVGEATLRVLPRVSPVAKTPALLDQGQGPRAARPAGRLPTEGSFALREYQQGDDVRRIHWVRSLAAPPGTLIVRLPDEVPPDRPRVRLVLDTFFPEILALDCDAPSELLDALVRVWLAVARSLAEQGARVTLVTAIPRGDARDGSIGTTRLAYALRAPDAARRLGADVAWQHAVPIDELLTDEATFVISRGVLTTPPPSGKVRWIVVVPSLSDPPMPSASGARLPFPMGATDNRWSTRRRVQEERSRTWSDHGRAVVAMRTNVAEPPRGSFAAYAGADGAVHLQAIQ